MENIIKNSYNFKRQILDIKNPRLDRGFFSRLILNENHEKTKQEQSAQSTGLKWF